MRDECRVGSAGCRVEIPPSHSSLVTRHSSHAAGLSGTKGVPSGPRAPRTRSRRRWAYVVARMADRVAEWLDDEGVRVRGVARRASDHAGRMDVAAPILRRRRLHAASSRPPLARRSARVRRARLPAVDLAALTALVPLHAHVLAVRRRGAPHAGRGARHRPRRVADPSVCPVGRSRPRRPHVAPAQPPRRRRGAAFRVRGDSLSGGCRRGGR